MPTRVRQDQMRIKKPAAVFLFAFLVFCGFASPLRSDAASERPLLMTWYPPPPGDKMQIIAGLDLETLEALTESGVVQYFQPRPEKGRWDIVVGMMIHAPAQTVWDVATDYPGLCQLLPKTFDSCQTVSKQGNQTVMHYLLHSSVLRFPLKLDITDEIIESAPDRWRLNTIKGSLAGREVDLLLIPIGADRTLALMRYYGALTSINLLVKTVLALLPDLESPVYASAAAYHLRSYKNEAEKRAGYSADKADAPLDFSRLEPATLNQLCRWYGGLVRETSQGKTINSMAFTSIDAPRETAWEVMSDFEHYDRFFPDSTTIVEKREQNQVVLRQSRKAFSVYIFSYDFDLHARYFLEEPSRMSWQAIDGPYRDSKGDFALMPYDQGKKTFVFATAGIVTERDQSLTMKIVKSGEFPFESMVNLFFARSVLNQFKLEAEKRTALPGQLK